MNVHKTANPIAVRKYRLENNLTSVFNLVNDRYSNVKAKMINGVLAPLILGRFASK